MRLQGALEDIQPVTQHRLAQALSVSDPAISRVPRPLETVGLVQVRPDPEHGQRRLGGYTPLFDALGSDPHAAGRARRGGCRGPSPE